MKRENKKVQLKSLLNGNTKLSDIALLTGWENGFLSANLIGNDLYRVCSRTGNAKGFIYKTKNLTAGLFWDLLERRKKCKCNAGIIIVKHPFNLFSDSIGTEAKYKALGIGNKIIKQKQLN